MPFADKEPKAEWFLPAEGMWRVAEGEGLSQVFSGLQSSPGQRLRHGPRGFGMIRGFSSYQGGQGEPRDRG